MSAASGSRRVALPLEPALVERVLSKLGLSQAPATGLVGLRALYDAWCRRVPFDNVRKRIHLHQGLAGPLPGDAAVDFFEAWLAHGTGGTCWAGNGALQALLASLGFAARRGCGTMLVRPDLPPNHGTVIVAVDGALLLVDASILFGEPLPLVGGARVDHPAWGVALHRREGALHVAWRPFHATFDCRLDALATTAEEFRTRHEATRSFSPFNGMLSARRNEGETVIGVSFGQLGSIDASGALSLLAEPSPRERFDFLVEHLGISEEMAGRLPKDEPSPLSSLFTARQSS
jgi:N-hydroxyarylamine O-acetyltransferase